MSQGFFCDSLVFLSGIVQGLLGLFYAFLGIFGVSSPIVSDPVGSIFGCNL
jgi:hypothetical protein